MLTDLLVNVGSCILLFIHDLGDVLTHGRLPLEPTTAGLYVSDLARSRPMPDVYKRQL